MCCRFVSTAARRGGHPARSFIRPCAPRACWAGCPPLLAALTGCSICWGAQARASASALRWQRPHTSKARLLCGQLCGPGSRAGAPRCQPGLHLRWPVHRRRGVGVWEGRGRRVRVQLHVLRLLLLQRRLRLRLVLRLVPRAFPAGGRAHAPRATCARACRARTRNAFTKEPKATSCLQGDVPGSSCGDTSGDEASGLTSSRRAQALVQLGFCRLSRSAKEM